MILIQRRRSTALTLLLASALLATLSPQVAAQTVPYTAPTTGGLLTSTPERGLSSRDVGRPAAPDPATELPELRTKRSRTYAEPNGVKRAVIAQSSINYRDAAGRWQPIDSSLVGTGSGDTRGWKTKANDFEVNLPKDLTREVRIVKGADSVAFRLVGARPSEATVIGQKATYNEVLPGVTATYASTPEGVKEDLVLASPAAPSTFTFEVATGKDVTANVNAQGGVDFAASGRTVFSIAPPYMYDASRSMRGRSQAVKLRLATRAQGGYTIVLEADRAWLSAPERRYPVVIDPHVGVNDWEVTSCGVYNTWQENENHCWDGDTWVGAENDHKARSLLRFTTLQDVVPQSAHIEWADLWQWQEFRTTDAWSRVDAHVMNNWWNTGATWNSRWDGWEPWWSAGGDHEWWVAAEGEYSHDNWFWWHPVDVLQEIVAGERPNQGFLFKQAGEGSYQMDVFASAHHWEAWKRPSLQVGYRDPDQGTGGREDLGSPTDGEPPDDAWPLENDDPGYGGTSFSVGKRSGTVAEKAAMPIALSPNNCGGRSFDVHKSHHVAGRVNAGSQTECGGNIGLEWISLSNQLWERRFYCYYRVGTRGNSGLVGRGRKYTRAYANDTCRNNRYFVSGYHESREYGRTYWGQSYGNTADIRC